MNERTEQAMREAFAKKCPEDDVMLRLAEDNQDFWLDAINARHALARFREGWLAAQVSIATPQPQPQTVRDALEKAARKLDNMRKTCTTDFGKTALSMASEEIRAIIEPTSALAIDTAAKMQAAEVVEKSEVMANELGLGDNAEHFRAIKDDILATIPQDGITALEEFGMKCARSGEVSRLSERFRTDDELRAIVTNLIGERASAAAQHPISEDLASQIANLEQRIEREPSFSHLDMVNNVLPIIRNLEAQYEAGQRVAVQYLGEIRALRRQVYEQAGRLNEVLLTKGVQECLDAATKSEQSSSSSAS